MDDCSALQQRLNSYVDVFVSHRLTFLVIIFTAVNLITTYFKQTYFPSKFHASIYTHMDETKKEELSFRQLQLIIGGVISTTGYTCIIIDCIVLDCYAISTLWAYLFGSVLASLDLHEYARRWPLPTSILGHHIMVFICLLLFVEFREAANLNISSVIFVANIGICWVSDYFHVVYRTSEKVDYIEQYKQMYLYASPVRLVNILLLAVTVYQSILQYFWPEMILITGLCIAYTYNSYRAVTFVLQFNSEQYFKCHQELWFGKYDSTTYMKQNYEC